MAQSVLSSIGQTAERTVKEFADASREKFDAIKKKSLEDLYGDTKDWVRQNPGKTLAGALATCFLIGRFLLRS